MQGNLIAVDEVINAVEIVTAGFRSEIFSIPSRVCAIM